MSWIEDLDKTTVICFVDSFAESAIKHIVGYDKTMSHPFIDEEGQHWKRAEPVKSEDLYDSSRT
jgi:hypothetical protein